MLAAERHEPARLKEGPDTTSPVDRRLRHVLEVRHESFRTPAFGRLLRRHAIGLVVADSAGTWPMFEEVTASSLVKVDMQGLPVGSTPFLTNPAGFTIHSAIHMARPDAAAVMHLHTAYGQVSGHRDRGRVWLGTSQVAASVLQIHSGRRCFAGDPA